MGQQLQAIYGDEAKLTCHGYKRICKGEQGNVLIPEGRTRVTQNVRISITTPKVKQRKENASDECSKIFMSFIEQTAEKNLLIPQLKIVVVKDFTNVRDARQISTRVREIYRFFESPPQLPSRRVTVSFDYFFLPPFMGLEPSRIRSAMSSKQRKMKNLIALLPDRNTVANYRDIADGR